MSTASSDTMEDGNLQNNDEEMASMGKGPLICDDIAFDVMQFLTREELGRSFSLVSRRFHALSYAKIHDEENQHWVEGDDHWLVVRQHPDKSVFLIKRNNYHELAQLPDIGRPPNVLGIHGIINFNGLLTDQVLDFIHHALEPTKTVLNLPVMAHFYQVNGLSMGQKFSRFERLLDSVLHIVTDTQNGELLKWLMQSDGKWRDLVLTDMRYDDDEEDIVTTDSWIKQIVQDFVRTTHRCNFTFTFNSYLDSVAESSLKNPVTNEILQIGTITPEYHSHKIYMVRYPVEMRNKWSIAELDNYPCKLMMKAEKGFAASI